MIKEDSQPYLFEMDDRPVELDSRLWYGSFNGRESSLQQISPYVGKMKSGMAKVLISLYSQPGDVVLDPFSGSGVVPFEAILAGREAWANDLSPYAYTLTLAKLSAPENETQAIHRVKDLLTVVESESGSIDLDTIPDWIKDFFHPKTLREIIVAFRHLRSNGDYFLIGCLLGILHHVRPGFLSYPSSHLVPYLRKKKYPIDQYPEMYEYRDLGSRLIAKVRRMYRRHMLVPDWERRRYSVWQKNAMSLPVHDSSVNAIVSSPPYYGALDYARDNRLRLWFLGCEDWKALDSSLTASSKVYLDQMSVCIEEMYRILKPNGHCVLVLGDVVSNGRTRRTAEILSELAVQVTSNGFVVETIYDDVVPDERRSRRNTKTTKFERILVMCKKANR